MCAPFPAYLLSPGYVAGDLFEDQVQPLSVASGVVGEGHLALLRPVLFRSAASNNGRSLREQGTVEQGRVQVVR